MSHDISRIADNPSEYGFRWITQELAHRGIDLPDCPIPELEDLEKVLATFGPKFFLDMANGTSLRVHAQRIAREAVYEDRKVDRNEVKRDIVAFMFGTRRSRSSRTVVVEKAVFMAPDGTKFETAEEAMKYTLELVAKQV